MRSQRLVSETRKLGGAVLRHAQLLEVERFARATADFAAFGCGSAEHAGRSTGPTCSSGRSRAQEVAKGVLIHGVLAV